MTRQDNSTTMTELPAHISRHLEPLVGGIEAIQQKDFAAMSLYGALAFQWGLIPTEGTFSEIRDGLIEAAKIHDEQRLTKSEGEGKKALSLYLNDWVMGLECGDKGQKFTHPAHCLDYILRLFPDMEKEEAWYLAQAESKKRNEIKREVHWEPSIEDEADYSAMESVNKKIPDWMSEEDAPLKPRNRQEFINEILWTKQYYETYRSILRTTFRLAILTVCYRGIQVRREGRVHSSSSKSASQHRQKDDSGGDGESDQGDPPGPSLSVPPSQTSLFIPKLNSLPLSRTFHPCCWCMERRGVA